MSEAWITHRGGCHCGLIRFEVDAPADLDLIACNCSICTMGGFLHLIVPQDRFRLIQGDEHLTTYQFGTLSAQHVFCSRCGIKSFYYPRSHPDGISVNANCLVAETVQSRRISPFDGLNWEDNISSLHNDPDDSPST